jgi:hypothetical protein
MKQKVNIASVKENPDNPRFIKDSKFKKLVKSIKAFPEMFEVWIDIAEGWTEEQKREFIVKDNVGFGEWDWDILANEWNTEQLADWGLDVWQPEEDVDYSILDDEDFSSDLEDMKNGVKKAIQIPFELEHYEEAFELVKHWREQGAYVGMMLIEKLKQEKK